MADYYAILQKTLGGLPNTVETTRQAVYAKAKSTIERQLSAMDPKPSDAVIGRQMEQLQAAIDRIETEYVEPAAEEVAAPGVSALDVQTPAVAPAEPTAAIDPAIDPAADLQPAPASVASEPVVEAPTADGPPPSLEYSETIFAEDPSQPRAKKKSGFMGTLISIVLAFAVIGGGIYALWINKDALLDAILGDGTEVAQTEQPKPEVAATEDEKPAIDEDVPEEEPEAPREVRVVEGSEPALPVDEVKDNAQLNNSGQTVEAEPVVPETPSAPTVPTASEEAATPTEEQPSVDPEVNEVAQAQPEAPAADEATTEPKPDATEQSPSLAVAQKAFLYEEGNSGSNASRDIAAIIWSLDKESIDGGEAEAVIKGKLDIPSRGLVMNMSIKRNLDDSLPASHIIEMLFTTPSEFSGGNIANVARFVMKADEQERGTGLVAVPAKISDGYFLIALNNLDQAKKTNRSLLLDNSWIDIPLGYTTGRRALVTLEKGAIGNKVFRDAFADWDARQG